MSNQVSNTFENYIPPERILFSKDFMNEIIKLYFKSKKIKSKKNRKQSYKPVETMG